LRSLFVTTFDRAIRIEGVRFEMQHPLSPCLFKMNDFRIDHFADSLPMLAALSLPAPAWPEV